QAPVTLDNVEDFVRKLCFNQYMKPRAKALYWITQGFGSHDTHFPTLSMFTREELREMYSGNETVSEADFVACLSFEDANSYKWSSRAMRATRGYLLEAIQDEAFRKQLLRWSTGYTAIPYAVNKKFIIKVQPGIRTSDGRVTIHQDRLPEASTCFNELRLPSYSSLAKLQEAMATAMAVNTFNVQ
ncbi:hypothetical protein JKP88DRAFT_163345, partial [Tribonema minus]